MNKPTHTPSALISINDLKKKNSFKYKRILLGGSVGQKNGTEHSNMYTKHKSIFQMFSAKGAVVRSFC